MSETVLCYIENENNQYLMLHRVKEKNDLNQGKWLGVGGHIEDGELPEDALVREVKEETGLDLLEYTKRGIVEFLNDEYKEIMHLYTSTKYTGALIECDEGILKWIDKNKILFLNLWEGDKVFLNKLFFTNNYFSVRLIYKDNKFIRSEEL